MHNPLALLSSDVLDGLIAGGHQYFVRQSYPRGFDHFAGLKEALLITPYKEFSQANAHFQTIKEDLRKYVYQLEHTGEREKLYIAAGQPTGYRIFVSLLEERDWRPPEMIGTKIKNFLRAYTKWKPERGEQINVSLYIQFGELFINLKFRNEQMKVPLSTIEKV